MHLPNGHQLQSGKYKLTYVIGQGGFGITYRGIWHTEVQGSLGKIKTDVSICIKEYFFKDYCYRDHASSEVKVHSETGKILFNKFKEKLIKEARILSDVHHPYIVNVLEVFEENNTAYIVMEYIDGYSLKQRMEKEGLLSENRMLKYIHQIGEALQFVHENNILHLDIKPSNILIDKNDNARLIDFGVSKRYDIEEQETSTTMLTLSKGFASIEQYDNEGTVAFSPKPDIYSLGATIYNLLTGKIPVESILRATKVLPKPSEINPSISSKTEQVILKAMEISPASRYDSVIEMMKELDKYVPEPSKKEINKTSHSYDQTEDETTLLNTPYSEDDDKTILNPHYQQPSEKKKSKKKLLIPFIISLFVVASFATIMMYNKPEEVVNAKPAGITTEQQETIAEVENDIPAVTTETSKPEDKKPGIQQTEPSTEARGEAVIPPPVDTVETPRDAQEEDALSVEAEDDKIYEELLKSGKAKYASADYSGALDDFQKASDAKLTEEIVRLKVRTDEQIELQKRENRKAQYEVKRSFGPYQIVRKISDDLGLYGAIDDNGNEVIPCKYINVGITDNGNRAFERDDLLYDIYNDKGELISKGVPYY